MKTICIAYTFDNAELEKAKAYDYVISNQVAQNNLGTNQLGYMNMMHTTNPDWGGVGNRIMQEYQAEHGDDAYWSDETGVRMWSWTSGSGIKRSMPIYNFTKPEFKTAMIAACSAVIDRFGGLFIDNCQTTFPINNPMPSSYTPALQNLLDELRAAHPHAIIIGNSMESWRSINGTMAENRVDDERWWSNLPPIEGQTEPHCSVVVQKVASMDDPTIAEHKARAHSMGAMYYATTAYSFIPEIIEPVKRKRKRCRLVKYFKQWL